MISVAAMAAGWQRPIVLGNVGTFRLWSVSKAVTATAVLETAAAKGVSIDPVEKRAMVAALTESDNCAQRRTVVTLQQEAGGPVAAAAAFRGVLQQAGGNATGPTTAVPYTEVEDGECDQYMAANVGRSTLAQIEQPALQLGTFEWNLRDAVRFAYALGSGRFGDAGAQVLRWMRRPKARATEGSVLDYTSPLDLPPSGGRFPQSWRPAYKGGWGGHEEDNFISEQIDILEISGSTVALAAVYFPSVQPPSDDPGLTSAPEALESVFNAAKNELARLSTTAAS
jgi:hypothetical protein